SASSIRTGGSPSSGRVASTNAARQASRSGHSLGCFALATLPVSLSRSAYARSPTTPPSPTSTASSSSPRIDFTGYLQSARIVPTRPLELTLPTPTSASRLLPSRAPHASEPIDRLGVSLRRRPQWGQRPNCRVRRRADLLGHRCRRVVHANL